MIIGFTGPMGSGKTTAAAIASRDNYISFADPLKKAAETLFGFDRKQLYTLEGKETTDPEWGVSPREVLQWLGTDVLRRRWPDFWVILMKKRVAHICSKSDNMVVVIDDCRFNNEAEFIRSNGTLIHITGRAAESKHSGHASEKRVEFADVDLKLDNSGSIQQLEYNIECIMQGVHNEMCNRIHEKVGKAFQ